MGLCHLRTCLFSFHPLISQVHAAAVAPKVRQEGHLLCATSITCHGPPPSSWSPPLQHDPAPPAPADTSWPHGFVSGSRDSWRIPGLRRHALLINKSCLSVPLGVCLLSQSLGWEEMGLGVSKGLVPSRVSRGSLLGTTSFLRHFSWSDPNTCLMVLSNVGFGSPLRRE